MKNSETHTQIQLIFAQVRALRDSVGDLQVMEEHRAQALRGQQTVDTDEAVDLSFRTLKDEIARIEEVLTTIAEAVGDIPKL